MRRLSVASDWLAAATILALPWSTSATSILIVAWLAVTLPTFDRATLRAHLRRPAVYLPIALWLLAAVGMLWADSLWADRWHALRPFHKLLLIPPLIVHFSRSGNGLRVASAFLLSAAVLLVYSFVSLQWPDLVINQRAFGRMPGVPIKDYIYQSICFALAVVAFLHLAIALTRNRRYVFAALALALVALFLANMAYVATSRTALVVLPVLLLTIGYQRGGWRGAGALLVATVLLGSIAWSTSPYLQNRVEALMDHAAHSDPSAQTSESLRLDFWRRSVRLLKAAPIIGHGTGEMREEETKAHERQQTDMTRVMSNPHNQTLAVGVQLGAVGIVLLYAMWLSHLALFRGHGWASWFGLIVVVQNIVASAFNSHLSDFTAGWLYVLGVGVLGGTVMRKRTLVSPVQASPQRSSDPPCAAFALSQHH